MRRNLYCVLLFFLLICLIGSHSTAAKAVSISSLSFQLDDPNTFISISFEILPTNRKALDDIKEKTSDIKTNVINMTRSKSLDDFTDATVDKFSDEILQCVNAALGYAGASGVIITKLFIQRTII